MRQSLLKTLACKHKSTVRKMHRKYAAVITTPHGPRKCLQMMVERKGKAPLVTRFGGIPLKRQEDTILYERSLQDYAPQRVQLIQRLLAEKCEICGAEGAVEIHHIRKLSDLESKNGREKPLWVRIMSAQKRKSLALCPTCHRAVHSGQPVHLGQPVSGKAAPSKESSFSE